MVAAMKFELNTELIGQIVFGMENQETVMVFDSEKLELVDADQAFREEDSGQGGDDRFLPLPEWRSVDGFNLMESFVVNLRNPVVREELRGILKNGRGVFRQFKNALKDRPEIERLWFHHRQKEMNQRVLDWYNDYREIWGLAPYTVIEQDGGKDDLVFSDFEFRSAHAAESAFLADWDRQLFEEMFPDASALDRQYYHAVWRSHLPPPAAEAGSRVLVATTPDGAIAGFIWSFEMTLDSPYGNQTYGRVVQVASLPEFRGIGIGSALIRQYHQQAVQRGLRRILINLPARAEFLSKNLQSLGFTSHGTCWEADLLA